MPQHTSESIESESHVHEPADQSLEPIILECAIYIYIYIYIYVETHIHLRVEHAHPRVDMETHIRFDSSFANLGILFELIAWAFDNVRRKGSWCASQYDGEWQVPSNYAWHGANALS